ncbi:unnamed protein product, partial [Closterium sp. Yama58-4]
HAAAAAIDAAVGGAASARCVETIRSSRHSLLAILNDILDLSKVEEDQLEMGTATSASPRASRTVSTCSRCPIYLECRWQLCPAQCARSPSTSSSPRSSPHLPPPPPPAHPLLPTLLPPDTAH